MQSCLTDLYFFPSIAYFKKIQLFDEIYIESYDNFVKQTYRNRAHILGPNGVDTLNVPVLKAQTKQLYKDVKIDYSVDWERKNYQMMRTAYANSPFFYDYYVFIEEIFNKKNVFLFDLNMSLLDFCFRVLQNDKIINPTNSFNITYKEGEDYRELVYGKRKNMDDWGQNDIKTYKQMFGKEFVSNLSVLDLMFNAGPESIKYFT